MYNQVETQPVTADNVYTDQPTQFFDAIIIGAGLGGLLSAAQLLERGKRVLIVERLPHCGGRFTAKTFQGVQVSTGAVHMVPFGSSGVLSHMLQRLQVPHHFFDADVFGSFHVHGRQYTSRGILGVFKFLGPRQFALLVSLGYRMFIRKLPLDELNQPYSVWLARKIDVARNRQLVAFFERISRFALSLELAQVSTAEVVAITKNMFRYGAPAIVRGGCGALTQELEQHVSAHGGIVQLSSEVVQILHTDDGATGVQVRDKASGAITTYATSVVVSDIGPRATQGLLHGHKVTQAQVLKSQSVQASGSDGQELHEAVGLKIHILSDVSLIPHKGIMYCLDTQRIAGMVQPTNSDARLAPPGKHLVISHQVIQSNDVEQERALALADLRMMFGETFEKHCRILTMGTYRGEWPVNRSAQGEDVQVATATRGLYLVGDAVKPTGYLMVEGVAQSVNRFLDELDEKDKERCSVLEKHVLPPPPRRHALRWLLKAPGNALNTKKIRKI